MQVSGDLKGLIDAAFELGRTTERAYRAEMSANTENERVIDPYVAWVLDSCPRDGHIGTLLEIVRQHEEEDMAKRDTTGASEQGKPEDKPEDKLAAVKAAVLAKRAEEAANPMKQYTFTGAYGTMVMTNEPPQIHDCVQQLRLKVGHLEAKKLPPRDGERPPQFPVKSSRELMQKFCQALVDLKMAFYPVEIGPQVMEGVVFSTDRGPKPGTGVHLLGKYRLVAPDHSFVDFMGFGGGLDRDDKAGGKASTYAYKDALLKALGIPEKELVDTDDEAGQGADRMTAAEPEEEDEKPKKDEKEKPKKTRAEKVAPNTASVDEIVKRINDAADGAALLAIASEARKVLDQKGQEAAGAAYRARKKALGL